jgi:hypothetical protein
MTEPIPENSEINDIRMPPNFKGISFSKYKKTEVRAALTASMVKGRVEPACYWGAELICAGHYGELWEAILHYFGKHIHLANPKLILYLEMRYKLFKNIMLQGHYLNELQLRNNSTIRKLFAEIISTLTLSNKKHSFESIKVNSADEFDITQISEKLKAPSTEYATEIYQKEDPKELYIAINEFAYNITSKNMLQASYWIEWIVEFDIICKKRKQPTLCQRRNNENIDKKFQRDIIWMVWDVLCVYATKISPAIEKLMKSLYVLFSVKYTTGSCKKRRYIMYLGVALLTEPISLENDVITQKETIQVVVSKINEIYKQIKKNEESPNTDYLFSNLDKTNNFEKSMKRMELLTEIDTNTRGIGGSGFDMTDYNSP